MQLFTVPCGCCLSACDQFRACFSGQSITITFSGITGSNCDALNTSYTYTFSTLASGVCLVQINGEEYDFDYCVTGVCDGTYAAAPEWGFGINATTGRAICQVGYDFKLSTCFGASVGAMNFGHNHFVSDLENTRALAALSGLCNLGSVELPFRIQNPAVCCTGSTGKVLVEMS